MFGLKEFQKMKPSAVLNQYVARGGHLDEAALHQALLEGGDCRCRAGCM